MKMIFVGAGQVPSNVLNTPAGNSYAVDSNGMITGVLSVDVTNLIRAGFAVAIQNARKLTLGAIAAASLVDIVANVALAAGARTIAAQPDVPRKLTITLIPGAAAITAGSIVLVYTAADGSTMTDTLSLITGSGVTLTQKTSKPVAVLTSATVVAPAGGSSPTIEVGSSTSIGLVAPQGAVAFSAYKEATDGANNTIGTVDATAGTIILNTAPNATHTYEVYYNFYCPG